jgi:hypothetical protein
MKGCILSKLKLIDKRIISFVFFDEEAKREISCQTAVNSDAPAMLEKMKDWRHVFIDGNWITDDRGQAVVFRIDKILPKKDEVSAN